VTLAIIYFVHGLLLSCSKNAIFSLEKAVSMKKPRILFIIFSFFISLVYISLGASSTLHAAPHGYCRKSYHEDSAGRGIEAGFKNQNLRPAIVDENCYQQGVAEGSLLPTSETSCKQDFEAGKANGLQANSTSLGTTCSSKGYIAGVALLHIAAREGQASLVGQICVDEYRRGLSDGNANRVAETGTDNIERECYFTGFYDASPL
jgi:hypothetical protein